MSILKSNRCVQEMKELFMMQGIDEFLTKNSQKIFKKDVSQLSTMDKIKAMHMDYEKADGSYSKLKVGTSVGMLGMKGALVAAPFVGISSMTSDDKGANNGR